MPVRGLTALPPFKSPRPETRNNTPPKYVQIYHLRARPSAPGKERAVPARHEARARKVEAEERQPTAIINPNLKTTKRYFDVNSVHNTEFTKHWPILEG